MPIILVGPAIPLTKPRSSSISRSAPNAKFLTIDIEADDPSRFMSLQDTAKFIEYVHSQTQKYPAIYVNYSVYERIRKIFDASSVFARAPLWLARFEPDLGMNNHQIWSNYTLWQFSSELNCNQLNPVFTEFRGRRLI